LIDIHWSLPNTDLQLGLLEASGVHWSAAGYPSEGLLDDAISAAVSSARQGNLPPEPTRVAIRDLLRSGGFKPTGRSKPASEYLAKAAIESFPRISNLVDINNLVSLQTGWPCSMIDLDLASDQPLEIRLGRKEEAYVFNGAGHSIDVAGLICVARLHGDPIANPVKDSMATKARESTSRVLFVAYASQRVASQREVVDVLTDVGNLLQRHAGAASVEAHCLPADA